MVSASPRKSTRTPGERVTSIQAVQDAALNIIDNEGLHVLSMRKLADRLGVGVMSLYRYVKTKDELLNAIAARVLEGVMEHPPSGIGWEEAVTQMMWRLEDTLRLHPDVAPLIVGNQAPLATLDPFREAMLTTLREAGLSVRQSAHATTALIAYATGVALIERSVSALGQPGMRSIADEFPRVAEARSFYAEANPEEARRTRFKAGLNYLLDGIKADLDADRRS